VSEPPRALAVRGLRFAYPTGGEVLAGVDLDVPAGGFVSVVGPSGCGKSTLLGIVAGLAAPTAGQVGLVPPALRREPAVALVTQGADLLPWRRVLANLTLGARLAGADADEARAEARRLAARFGLGDHLRAWPAQLSGGMRQRAALLRAVLTPAPVLALDEPFNALDPLTRRDVHAFVAELGRDQPRTTLLVTHDVDEAVRLSDTVVVLTARPATVAGRVVVGDPRPRPDGWDLGPTAGAAKAAVLELLAGGGRPAPVGPA
jgi:ABC-type nitrate/sulfonate/bicarbonate transport system ATPase subunit